jgi:signal-transduction protein with cAMP-binding, CBS, and nucleotidyltransferase domain
MCLPIIGLGLTIAATFGQAMLTSAQAKQEAVIEQEQLRVEMENERIKGMGDTNDRLEQFRKDEAANRAALSTTGVSNLSYSEALLPANQRIVQRDVRAIAFNAGQQIARKKYEIGVAGYRAKATGRGAFVEAGTRSVGEIGSYLTNRSGG